MRASVPTQSASQRGCVPGWFTCQKRANFSFLLANVPIKVATCQMTCQFFSSVCQRAKRHANFSNIYLTKCFEKFLYFIIIWKIQHFTWNHSYRYHMYMYLFCFLVRNYNIKRPGFYTLQVARVFSNFPQLKQLSKIKNTYVWILRSSWIMICLSWRSQIVIRKLIVTMFLSLSSDYVFEYCIA